jgi:hypothetical protein
MTTRYAEVPLTPYGKWAQGELYSTADRAMAGGGLALPGDVARMTRLLQTGLDREYGSSKDWTQTHLDRTVAPEDTTVRNYITSLGRSNYATARNSVPEQFQFQRLADMGTGTDLATDAISGERGVASQLAGMHNQQSMTMSQIPSMMEGIMGGLGRGLGWAAGSIGNTPVDPAVRYGQIMTKGTGMPSGYSGSQSMRKNVNDWMGS